MNTEVEGYFLGSKCHPSYSDQYFILYDNSTEKSGPKSNPRTWLYFQCNLYASLIYSVRIARGESASFLS